MAAEFNEKEASIADIGEDKVPSYDGSNEMGPKGQDVGSPHDVANEKGIFNQEHEILKDGVRLHPQPTADPLDPLNWSSFRKHIILAIVMYL